MQLAVTQERQRIRHPAHALVGKPGTEISARGLRPVVSAARIKLRSVRNALGRQGEIVRLGMFHEHLGRSLGQEQILEDILVVKVIEPVVVDLHRHGNRQLAYGGSGDCQFAV